MARIWAEIDCRQWKRNYKAFARQVEPLFVVPVLKSDGYGLGAGEAAQAFRQAGAKRIAVATLDEAKQLRNSGLEIQFLGVPEPDEIPFIVKNGWIGSVPDIETANLFTRAAVSLNRTAFVHILIDSGMGRLGFLHDQAKEAITYIASLPGVTVEGLYSHFPAAEKGDAFAHEQIKAIDRLKRELTISGINPPYCHMANSYAVSAIPESYRHPFNMVRPGIELHGVSDKGINLIPGINPVITLKARLVSVRKLPAGHTIGYNRTYTLKQDSLIGTIAAGYADGYPRSLSNKGKVLIRGYKCPVIGSVCMDYIQVLLDDVPQAKKGEEVVLAGQQKEANIPVEQLAHEAGTIAYEILTRLGHRVERCYHGL